MKQFRKLATVLAVMLVGLAFYAWLAKRELATLTPSSEDVSFATFADEMPPPRVLTHIHLRDGGERFVWSGEIADMILPSGGSCYIFDESGILVDWSPTTGDGESVDHIWRHAIEQKPVTIEDVQAILKAG